MPDTSAFLTEPRETAPRQAVADRVRDWFERALMMRAPKEAVHA
jgi:hypothetical protein